MAASEVVTVEAFAGDLDARTRCRRRTTGGPRVVAVDGWSGSGKTLLADRLAPALGAPCVHLDDWVPGWWGLARSVELLVEWVLAPLADDRPARWRRWDWTTGSFGGWEVLAPADLVVVEGCGAGTELARPWLSAVVWISVEDDERERRLRARPDWPTYAAWAGMWARQEQALRAGEDPGASADAIVETGPDPATLRVAWSR